MKNTPMPDRHQHRSRENRTNNSAFQIKSINGGLCAEKIDNKFNRKWN